VGAILTLMSALTVLSLFRVQWSSRWTAKPGLVPLLCAVVYVASAAWMLWFAVSGSPVTGAWIGAVVLSAAVAYAVTRSVGRAGAQ
jgi:hypothetical protein